MNHTCLKIDNTNMRIKSLNQVLAKDKSSKDSITLPGNEIDNNNNKSKEINNKLKEIIELTLQITDWRDSVQALLKFFFLVNFTNLSFLLCMSIYTLSDSITMACLTELIVYVPQLFVYCSMGTRVTTRIEKLTASLYDTNWYLMDVKQQNSIQFIMQRTQNMKGFDGVFSRVDMETFQQVWK